MVRLWPGTVAGVRYLASEVATATGGQLIGGDAVLDGAEFDSRVLRPGALFVPIVADRDGHSFIPAAVTNGAAAVLSAVGPAPGVPTIVVDNTSQAFVDLARWARGRFGDHVVAITGSVGKTSVKDLTAAVLATRWRTHAALRSYNNDQGLPHTMLNAPDDTEVLVFEMGMRGFGEIAKLCEVARPKIGIVTSVAAAHTERVGGIEGVARAKAELIDAMPADGVGILNADQPLVAAMAARCAGRVVTFGLVGDVRVENLVLDDLARARFTLATEWGRAEVALTVPGAHMAINAAAAAACGLVLDVPLDGVATGLCGAGISPWRMELHRTVTGAIVINDAYNANPASMRAALDTLAQLAGDRKVAMVGRMAELADPLTAHPAIAEYARELGIELIAVGTDLYGPEPERDPVAALGPVGPGTAILVKASRSAGLEKLAEQLLIVLGRPST